MSNSYPSQLSGEPSRAFPEGFDFDAWDQLMLDMGSSSPGPLPSSVELLTNPNEGRVGGFCRHSKTIYMTDFTDPEILAHEAQHFIDDHDGGLTNFRSSVAIRSVSATRLFYRLLVPVVGTADIMVHTTSHEGAKIASIAAYLALAALNGASSLTYRLCWAERRAFSAQRKHRKQAERVLANVALSSKDT